jgi:hypothetical protein
MKLVVFSLLAAFAAPLAISPSGTSANETTVSLLGPARASAIPIVITSGADRSGPSPIATINEVGRKGRLRPVAQTTIEPLEWFIPQQRSGVTKVGSPVAFPAVNTFLTANRPSIYVLDLRSAARFLKTRRTYVAQSGSIKITFTFESGVAPDIQRAASSGLCTQAINVPGELYTPDGWVSGQLCSEPGLSRRVSPGDPQQADYLYNP